jgi:hypothetical protein
MEQEKSASSSVENQKPIAISSELKERILNAFWVCDDCGNAFGRNPKTGTDRLSTYSPGKCDICEEEKIVTQFRDFGYNKPL